MTPSFEDWLSRHGPGGTLAQRQLNGQPAPLAPPAYDRDANAETPRLFDFPTGIRGQLALDTDPDEQS